METDLLTISFSHQPRKSQNQSWSKSCTVWAHMELPSHGKTAQQESDESQVGYAFNDMPLGVPFLTLMQGLHFILLPYVISSSIFLII